MSNLDGVELHLVNNVEMAEKFLSWLSQRRPHDAIAVDTETGELPGRPREDALSPWHGQLRLVQVGDGMQGWAIPWLRWNGVFHEAMSRWEGQTIFHNVAFEARWFAEHSDYRVPWHRAHDTMLMAHIINPLGSGALKTLCSQFVDGRAVSMQSQLDVDMAKNGWTWGTVPVDFQPYWAYGALDTVLTTRLWEFFEGKCGPGTAYEAVYDLEMGVRRVCTQMELNGARIDLEYSRAKRDELSTYAQSIKDWARDTYGKVSITSNVQLVRLLEKLGAEIVSFTPSGQKSADKSQLKLLVSTGSPEVQQLAQAVLNQRKADKLAATYFANFVERNIDGYVHPSIRTLGARTGRMSIQEPALQTLPKGEATVRNAFIPDDGKVLITSDLDQVEFRMFASLSNDKELISMFTVADETGSDAFTEIGRNLYGDPSMQKSDKRRGLVKSYIYGRLYGAGVAKQALTAGVPETQMRAVADAFDRAYPGVSEFQAAIEDVGMRRLRTEGEGYVLTRTGRRLPCDENRMYTLVNYLIQGGAAEVFKRNLLKLDAAGFGDAMIVPVHDEIVLQVDEADAADAKTLIKECMTTTEGWAVPLTAGVDGPLARWGDKY